MTLNSIQNWFLINNKGLREDVTPFGSDEVISRPIAITKENIINHQDTMNSYIEMIKEGITPDYYLNLAKEYINEYERLKIN